MNKLIDNIEKGVIDEEYIENSDNEIDNEYFIDNVGGREYNNDDKFERLKNILDKDKNDVDDNDIVEYEKKYKRFYEKIFPFIHKNCYEFLYSERFVKSNIEHINIMNKINTKTMDPIEL